MIRQYQQKPVNTQSSDRYLPLLILLFIGSGCAALVYEIVWFHMLQLIIGSSAVSIGVLLATFMGGMCIGSLVASPVISKRYHPLRVYAFLELSIGVLGILVFVILPYAGGLYIAIGGEGIANLLIRGILCAVCLLLPTIMMGATLPAIARWVEATPQGMSWLGFFYSGNIAGAVLGCLLAGFYLLRVYDVATATYLAAAINFSAALLGFAISKFAHYKADVTEPYPTYDSIPTGAWAVLLTIMLSGTAALTAEVVWTRLLSLILGATVYAFSLILAAFLLGLGIGSGIGSVLARLITNSRAALGWCQFLLIAGIVWAAYSMTNLLPYWSIGSGLMTTPAMKFQFDLLRCLSAVLPSACLWGASFPLALAGIVARRHDPGRLVGAVYAANTIGAIIGSLSASLLIISWLGTHGAQQIMIVLTGVGALLMLSLFANEGTKKQAIRFRKMTWVGLTIALSALAVWKVAAIPWTLVAYGRSIGSYREDPGELIYMGEGMNSSMAVSRQPTGALAYHNAGKIQASSSFEDMRLQRMLGHLSTLVPRNPRSVLIIGCGSGATAGAVSIDPAVRHVTIAELERLVPQAASTYFHQYNFDVIRNPKVQVVIDDARHYLITSKKKFDAITSDPFDPWVKGAAMLYTEEFFELLKQRLNPGGVVTVFVQFYQSSAEAVKSEFATFFKVFPKGTVWANTHESMGYDVVLLGQIQPTPIDLDAIEERLSRPEYALMAQSLRDIGFNSATELFSTFGGVGEDLKPWLQNAQINRDRNLRLQYLAGLDPGRYQQDLIYREMLEFRRFPETLFSGSPGRLSDLKAAITGDLY